MRILLLILFIQCTFSSSAQTTVMIMFNKQSTGDYDIMIRDILNDNGYDAFVNYGNDNLTSDLVIVYEDFAHEGDSSLESYSMALFRADGTKYTVI